MRDEARARSIASYLRTACPDVVMLQEVYAAHGFELVTPCPVTSAVAERLPEYGWIRPTGVSILSGSNPILYRKSRYMPMRQGVLWLSDTPEIPDSRSWGNDIPRYATWALLYDNAGGGHVLVMNVHLDHLVQEVNERGVDVLLETIRREAGGRPVILGGDFNAGHFMSARVKLSRALRSALQPAHGPTRFEFPSLQIDGLHLSDHLVVESAWVDPVTVYGPVGSDHAAVWAEVMVGSE